MQFNLQGCVIIYDAKALVYEEYSNACIELIT